MPESGRTESAAARISWDGLRGRDGHEYVPDHDLIAAAEAALALGMPLLLTGEAGCGKTDFAFAAAGTLARAARRAAGAEGELPLLECYVRSDSRARDLLYSYDAIRRFGDAQHGGEEGKARAADPRNYINLQPLGVALIARERRVVLIDEIDKAPRDLPNDLLRELDQGHFEIPEIAAGQAGGGTGEILVDDPRTYRSQMRVPKDGTRPFVIITSNVERQLPDPFLRRCVFFHIPFPDDLQLQRILAAHCPGAGALHEKALDIFLALRKTALTKKPTTAELIAWVFVLRALFPGPNEPVAKLDAFLANRTARDAWRQLDWCALPALGCLVKLHEDQEKLRDLSERRSEG